MVDPEVPAEVRARGYDLLSRLLLASPGGSWAEDARQLPALRALMGSETGADELAAAHYGLFGLQFPPYASLYLSEGGGVGSGVADEVMGRFIQSGVSPRESGVTADHLGHELQLLAALTERGDEGAVSELLGAHLLWWMPLYASGVRQAVDTFWRGCMELVLEATLHQARCLGVRPGSPPPPLATRPRDPLADEASGLAEIGRFIAAPIRSGVHLSVADLRSLGRRHSLPTGFGGRELMTVNLLRAGAQYDRLGHLVEEIAGLARRRLDDVARDLSPAESGFLLPWRDRVSLLESVTHRVGVEAGRIGREETSAQEPSPAEFGVTPEPGAEDAPEFPDSPGTLRR